MGIVTMADNQLFKRISLLLEDPDIYSATRATYAIFHTVWFVPLNCIWVFLSFCGLSRRSDIAYRHFFSCFYCAVRFGLHALWAICTAEHLATAIDAKNKRLNRPVDSLISGIAST
jgi:hypothetical protein